MKTSIPLAFLLLSAPSITRAQIFAGEVPDGGSTLDLNINLVVDQPNTMDSAWLEIDCDDFMDMMVYLLKGQPEVDAPHVAWLRMVDDDIELCADGVQNQSRPQYYAFGEPMDCAGSFDWQTDDVTVLGNMGGFTGIGPFTIDSMYVAVRRGTQVAWILLSFDLTGLSSVSLQVHSVLSLCSFPNSVDEHGPRVGLQVFPSVSGGEPIRVEATEPWQRLDLLDPTGRSIARYGAHVCSIAAPEIPGTYVVRATHADGSCATGRVIRY